MVSPSLCPDWAEPSPGGQRPRLTSIKVWQERVNRARIRRAVTLAKRVKPCRAASFRLRGPVDASIGSTVSTVSTAAPGGGSGPTTTCPPTPSSGTGRQRTITCRSPVVRLRTSSTGPIRRSARRGLFRARAIAPALSRSRGVEACTSDPEAVMPPRTPSVAAGDVSGLCVDSGTVVNMRIAAPISRTHNDRSRTVLRARSLVTTRTTPRGQGEPDRVSPERTPHGQPHPRCRVVLARWPTRTRPLGLLA